MKKQLATEWLKPAKTDKEREQLEAAIRHSTTALGRLKEILEDRLEQLEKAMTRESYETAAWPYLAADRNGEKRQIRETLLLLSFLN